MSFLTENYINLPNSSEDVCVKKISSKNINDFQDYNSELASVKKNYLEKFPDLCEFFGFFTKNGELAGHIGIMYKGGTDIGVFNVKNIDALIVDVFVSEKYRRRGICIQMLKEVLKYLNTEKNISKAHLIVRLRNHPARAAYRKAGGIEEFQARTFRILFKIPVHGYDL